MLVFCIALVFRHTHDDVELSVVFVRLSVRTLVCDTVLRMACAMIEGKAGSTMRCCFLLLSSAFSSLFFFCVLCIVVFTRVLICLIPFAFGFTAQYA